jgi:precorrin-3B synthase
VLSAAQADGVATALDAALCADPALAELPGRFLFAVAAGAGLVDVTQADVALAPAPGRPGQLALLLAGRDSGLRSAPGDAHLLALHAAAAFLQLRREQSAASGDAGAWRIAELAGGPAAVLARLRGDQDGELGAAPAAALPVAGQDDEPLLLPGLIEQRDGRSAVLVLVPLGELDAAQASLIAGFADELGTDLRVTVDRGIALPDLERSAAERVLRTLGRAGFVTDPESGWTGLSACAGAGRCARADADADVHGAALLRASQRGPGSGREHLVACERRCGDPGHGATVVVAQFGETAGEIAGRAATELQINSHVPGEPAARPAGPKATR